MTTTTETEAPTPVAVTRLATYGLFAIVIACVANALVRIVASTLFDVPAGFGPLEWAPVINTTVAGIVGATVVYGLLARVSNRPDRDFVGVALVVLLLSFVPLLVPPAFLAEAPASVFVTLATMHVTTAIVAVGLLPRTMEAGASSR